MRKAIEDAKDPQLTPLGVRRFSLSKLPAGISFAFFAFFCGHAFLGLHRKSFACRRSGEELPRKNAKDTKKTRN